MLTFLASALAGLLTAAAYAADFPEESCAYWRSKTRVAIPMKRSFSIDTAVVARMRYKIAKITRNDAVRINSFCILSKRPPL